MHQKYDSLRIITLTALLLFSMVIGFISTFSQEMAYVLLILFFAVSGYLFAKGKLPLWGKNCKKYSWLEIVILIGSTVIMTVVMHLLIYLLPRLLP